MTRLVVMFVVALGGCVPAPVANYHVPEVMDGGVRLGAGGGYSQFRAAFGEDATGYRAWEGRAFADFGSGFSDARVSLIALSAGRPSVDFINAVGLGGEIKASVTARLGVYLGIDGVVGVWGSTAAGDLASDDIVQMYRSGSFDLTGRLGVVWAAGRPDRVRLVTEAELSTTWLASWQLAGSAGVDVPLGSVVQVRPQGILRCYARLGYGDGLCSYGAQAMATVRLRGKPR